MDTHTLLQEPVAEPHAPEPRIQVVREHTLEIVSDPGEGAQKCGQIFGAVSAKSGNGVWTVEIIPAEIQPPPRLPEGASGNRIRIGTESITNWGDETNLIVAFNEQVLLGRHRVRALAPEGASPAEAPFVFAAVALVQALAITAFLLGRRPGSAPSAA